MNTEKLINDIKNYHDLIPDAYDGSYELVRSIIHEYAQMEDISVLNYKDLNAVYHMCIGTWKHSVEKKKESVEASSLPDASKQTLINLLDDVWDKACDGYYEHKTDLIEGKTYDFDGKPIIGMFGTGFYSFHNTTPEETQRFIGMCCQIETLDDEDKIFDICESKLKDKINGLAAASVSMILHCLKPYVFPIINGNYVGETIFPILGIELNKMKDSRTYIANCRKIRDFNDRNIGRKNYRVYDVFSLNLSMYSDNQIDIEKLKTAIADYKKNLVQNPQREIYKWENVKWFKEHWNIDADDFGEMFKNATKKADNLLTRMGFYPRNVILDIAKADQKYAREMFRKLYDESQPLPERVETFMHEAEFYNTLEGKQNKKTFQTLNIVSVYLFLMYPDRYFIYMPVKFEKTAEYLSYKRITNTTSVYSLEDYFRMGSQIWEYVKTDDELIQLNHSRLTPVCYDDKDNHLLAEDIIYSIYSSLRNKQDDADDDQYWPSYEEYPLELTKEDWQKYISEIEMPNHPTIMKMLKKMMNLGGEASPKQLSVTYGESPYSYVGAAVNLGRRAMNYFELQPVQDGENQRYFAIPFLGRVKEWNGKEYYTYKIRPELYDALSEMDLSTVDITSSESPVKTSNIRYWMYAPGKNASRWNECIADGVMLLGWAELEDLAEYNSRDEITEALKEAHGDKGQYWMDSLATWEFSHVIKPGDVIYVKKGRGKLIGRGVVTSEYYYDPDRGDMPNVMNVNWTHKGEWNHPGLAQVKTLTEVQPDTEYAAKLIDIFNQKPVEHEKYTDQNFLNEVFVSSEMLNEMKSLLLKKKNIILQGAPGVGKTFTAKRLAYTIMGEKDEDKIKFIQFHQNYSYEDFIMGYKPTDNGGFEMQTGVFYDFCMDAKADTGKKYFFIIDEINRGNLSKIFGELLMAIEADYRDKYVHLAYRDEDFTVPENVYLIGMMNTADRSLALIDYALRRRFSFIQMKPGFDTNGFKNRQNDLHFEEFNKLIETVKELNIEIENDESLGEGFCIGHSYFCIDEKDCTKGRLQQIVKYDLIPTLEEYWFDNKETCKKWKAKLEEAVK